MKATELMVGDVVRCNTLPYIQVASITKKKIGYHVKPNEPRMHYIRLCEVNPIPLTPEILEKNGFKNGKLNVSPQYYLEDSGVFIGVTLKDIPDKHKGIDIAKSRLFFQLDVSHIEEALYVHQLQHALRLCRIEKEIIL